MSLFLFCSRVREIYRPYYEKMSKQLAYRALRTRLNLFQN